MRRSISAQTRLDCNPVANVELNLACRDEIVPILVALQYIYKNANLRRKILALIAGDVNKDSDPDCGREGMDYWQILVLTAVRLGCNLDYDRLQDLAENHRRLRQIMCIGDWQENATFNWCTIRNNICLLSTQTITTINHLIVAQGHKFEPTAPAKSRADSFVVETNVHYPTDSNLMYDGVRKVIQLSIPLAETLGVAGWRQAQHLLKRARSLVREIARLVRSKDPKTVAKEGAVSKTAPVGPADPRSSGNTGESGRKWHAAECFGNSFDPHFHRENTASRELRLPPRPTGRTDTQ